MAKRRVYRISYMYACTGAVMGSDCYVYARSAQEAHFIWLVLATSCGWNYADITRSGFSEMDGDGDIVRIPENEDVSSTRVYGMNDAVHALNGHRGDYLRAVLPKCPSLYYPDGIEFSYENCLHAWAPLKGDFAIANAQCKKCGALIDEHGVWYMDCLESHDLVSRYDGSVVMKMNYTWGMRFVDWFMEKFS